MTIYDPNGAAPRWSCRDCTPDWIDLGWLADRPHRIELPVAGKTLLAADTTPWEPRGAYVYPLRSLLERFAEVEADFVLHQLVRRVGRVLVINPGSTGEARDSGNGRQLSCTVLDTATAEVVVTNFPDLRS